MKTMKRMMALASGVALLGGCSLGDSDTWLNGPPEAKQKAPEEQVVATPPPAVETPEEELGRCAVGKTYAGIGGRVLTAGRVDEDQNVDRARMKPYSALAAEYARVLGKTPSLLSQMGQVFGQSPARWEAEPQASAISLYTSYRVGFTGCLELTATGEAWAQNPSLGTADETCRAWATTFWSREPQATEVDACVQVAMEDTQKETNPRRRWAYVCASLLSSAGFLTY